MPATVVVFFERQGQMAARARGQMTTLPVRVREARSEADFAQAIGSGRFPIAILDAALGAETLVNALQVAERGHATSLIVGPIESAAVESELRERGADCLLPIAPTAEKWSAFLERLVLRSQSRFECCG